MTETITSKYYVGYWFKILLISGFEIFLLFLFIVGILNNAGAELLLRLFIMLAVPIAISVYWLLNYPVQRITVSEQNITIYQYLTRKSTVIKYSDINKIRTTGSTAYSAYSRRHSREALELELYNEKSYRLSGGELDNYGALKNAIYDNMWRHQQ